MPRRKRAATAIAFAGIAAVGCGRLGYDPFASPDASLRDGTVIADARLPDGTVLDGAAPVDGGGADDCSAADITRAGAVKQRLKVNRKFAGSDAGAARCA